MFSKEIIFFFENRENNNGKVKFFIFLEEVNKILNEILFQKWAKCFNEVLKIMQPNSKF